MDDGSCKKKPKYILILKLYTDVLQSKDTFRWILAKKVPSDNPIRDHIYMEYKKKYGMRIEFLNKKNTNFWIIYSRENHSKKLDLVY